MIEMLLDISLHSIVVSKKTTGYRHRFIRPRPENLKRISSKPRGSLSQVHGFVGGQDTYTQISFIRNVPVLAIIVYRELGAISSGIVTVVVCPVQWRTQRRSGILIEMPSLSSILISNQTIGITLFRFDQTIQ